VAAARDELAAAEEEETAAVRARDDAVDELREAEAAGG
jgi:hypothetical protein